MYLNETKLSSKRFLKYIPIKPTEITEILEVEAWLLF